MIRHRNARITAHNMTDQDAIALAEKCRAVLGLSHRPLAYVCEILAHAMPDTFKLTYTNEDDNMPENLTLDDLLALDASRVYQNPRAALAGVDITEADRANYPQLFDMQGEPRSSLAMAHNRLIELNTQAFSHNRKSA